MSRTAFGRAQPDGASQRRAEGWAVHQSHPPTAETGRPGRHGEHYARRHHGPSRDIDRPQARSRGRYPRRGGGCRRTRCRKKAKVQPNNTNAADPRPDRLLDGGVGLRPGGSGAQPDHQADGADAEDDAGDAIGDRQDRGELRPVDLDVGRERSRPRRLRCRSDRLDVHGQLSRSTIIFLISAMALPGFNPFGQVRVQLRMVWHRYSRNGSSRLSSRSSFASSRLSVSQRHA